MTGTPELLRRSWKPQEDADTTVVMIDSPKGWKIWVYADIDISFESYYNEDIKEEDDRETEESKSKDRTHPWVVMAREERRYVAVNVGPRFERVREALRWAENLAEDIDIAQGKIPLALGRTSGEA
jgi:hypothetical protein